MWKHEKIYTLNLKLLNQARGRINRISHILSLHSSLKTTTDEMHGQMAAVRPTGRRASSDKLECFTSLLIGAQGAPFFQLQLSLP